MTVFSVVSLPNNPALAALSAKIAEHYPSSHYKFADNVWYVIDHATAVAVSNKIGITESKGALGDATVMPLTGSYWGRTRADFWDWLKAAVEAQPNAK